MLIFLQEVKKRKDGDELTKNMPVDIRWYDENDQDFRSNISTYYYIHGF